MCSLIIGKDCLINIEIVFLKGYGYSLLIGFYCYNMRTVGVVTLLSLILSLGTGRPGKHFLVETEDDGNDVAAFNAPNVEEYEGKVQLRRVSASVLPSPRKP